MFISLQNLGIGKMGVIFIYMVNTVSVNIFIGTVSK